MGKLQKIFVIDKQKNIIGEAESRQIQDGFDGLYASEHLQEPPFPLEQLINLSESYPVHSAALEQKATDVVGAGWEWEADNDDDDTEEARQALDDRIESLTDVDRINKVFRSLWLDYETTGQGYLEIARSAEGEVTRVFHVPAHTLRAHSNGKVFAQGQGTKRVWFKKWGEEGEYSASTGEPLSKDEPGAEKANELLVFRMPTRKSTHYGVPAWMSAVGFIILAVAARDYNLLFFQNNREPRWVVILSDLDVEDDVEDALRQAFQVDLQTPHRNLIVPLQGGGKVTFQKLTVDQNDASFERLLAICKEETLIAHRVPPERIGVARVGPLGGNMAEVSNRTYRDGVIKPEQELFEEIWNHFLQVEFPEEMAGWMFRLVGLDISEELQDLDSAIKLFRNFIATLDEARQRAGLPPLNEEDYPGIGRQFLWQLVPQGKMQAMAAQSLQDSDEVEHRERLDGLLTTLNTGINELLFTPAGENVARPNNGTTEETVSTREA